MRHTDEMTVTLVKPGSKAKARSFSVSAAVARQVELFIKHADKDSKSIAADKVLLALADDAHRPATTLRGSRYKEGLTQKELADRLGIRQSNLSEMENGKRPIGKNMAKKLAEVFDCDYRVFV